MTTSSSSLLTSQSQVLDSANFLRSLLPPSYVPIVGIVGGSGLSALENIITAFYLDSDTDSKFGLQMKRFEIAFDEIPGFPTLSVPGHTGKLIFGTIALRQNKMINAVFVSGRAHLYEGNNPKVATFPIRVLGGLGMKIIIITNAAGSLNSTYRVGDVMIINDHISFPSLSGTYNPLLGPLDELASAGSALKDQRFLALSDAYDYKLRREVWHAWKSISPLIEGKSDCFHNVRGAGRERRLQEGVYAFVAGPSYETRAESRFLLSMGADVVGMSTVPEVIVARHIGLRVLGLSLVTNMVVSRKVAYGNENVEENECIQQNTEGKVNHAEVLEAGRVSAELIKNLIVETLELDQI